VLDKHGVDWFIARTQEKLAELDAGFQLVACGTEHDLPRPPIDRQGHVGVHAQSQNGLSYVGLALEMGRLSCAQMRAIGRAAIVYGRNDLRLTVWQNVLIPHVADDDVPALEAALGKVGIGTSATAFAAGAVACTGKAGCKLALAYTKENGTELVRHLETRFVLDRPINIHLTGCPNSCAQHYIADIGLVGATMKDGGEGYFVVLGGGSDHDKGIARPLCGPLPAGKVNATVETLIGSYLERRVDGQSFLEFVRALPDAELPSLLGATAAAA
ncbi:MAG: NirA family protein, partial [Pseudomonadota bacterium]